MYGQVCRRQPRLCGDFLAENDAGRVIEPVVGEFITLQEPHRGKGRVVLEQLDPRVQFDLG